MIQPEIQPFNLLHPELSTQTVVSLPLHPQSSSFITKIIHESQEHPSHQGSQHCPTTHFCHLKVCQTFNPVLHMGLKSNDAPPLQSSLQNIPTRSLIYNCNWAIKLPSYKAHSMFICNAILRSIPDDDKHIICNDTTYGFDNKILSILDFTNLDYLPANTPSLYISCVHGHSLCLQGNTVNKILPLLALCHTNAIIFPGLCNSIQVVPALLSSDQS